MTLKSQSHRKITCSSVNWINDIFCCLTWARERGLWNFSKKKKPLTRYWTMRSNLVVNHLQSCLTCVIQHEKNLIGCPSWVFCPVPWMHGKLFSFYLLETSVFCRPQFFLSELNFPKLCLSIKQVGYFLDSICRKPSCSAASEFS